MGLKAEWEDFVTTIPEYAPKREIEIMRRGYYVGAHTMLDFLIRMKEMSRDEAQALYESLVGELNSTIGSPDNNHLLEEADEAPR